MFSLVAPNRSVRSENSDTAPIGSYDTTTSEGLFEQALDIARMESIQWRTLYQEKPDAASIPFLDFFASKAPTTGSAAAHKSLLYRIVKFDTSHAANGATITI